MTALGHPGEFPEGRFFSGHLRFAAKTKDTEILTLAYNAMQKLIEASWPQHVPTSRSTRPTRRSFSRLHRREETGVPEERQRVAGVFVTRLRKGMRLQTDPTVIYGLGESYDGNIHSRDLVTDTPYNTYTRSGLPPYADLSAQS